MTESAAPRVSIVVPAYNEGDDIIAGLQRIVDAVTLDSEVLIVVDTESDTTIPPVTAFRETNPQVSILINDYGRGPANAIRYGIDHAHASTTVVTMADGCDDPRQIDDLVRLVERGVVVAAASRYMAGGQQVGGPRFKSFLSRTAGRSLHLFCGIGTRDATNSFKAYNSEFVREVGIDSRDGFEIGLELTAKAKRLRRPVAEIPTIWLDRTFGQSNFQLGKWIPKYLRWYRFAYGPQLTLDELRAKSQTVEAKDNNS
ncbi:glycosyltransferase family 2 protein [Humibacter ginsenosidimutans]|uniref:Glycosyltransferase family 2 protein n=1 Tax=Humibacter ginsenosidimutans TaxID=2599293 RepID=A0A5B8M6T3_9MICO|nr:glycosyltransferase family 2 protein [Humibacter ginsenosidimutans]QDZ16418.1 glycosyltransferase family 2 protein [Humibacter ginsenosidimutans]